MRKTQTIQILKVDNGFYINSISDEPTKNQKLIAADEQGMRDAVKKIIDAIAVNTTPTAVGGAAQPIP